MALSSFIKGSRVPGCASLTTRVASRSMLTTSTRSRSSCPAEQQQPLPQVDGKVLVERREQHVLAGTIRRQPLDQPFHAVERDDGLPGAWAPADSRGSAVGPFDDPPLDGVQVHLPAFEASLEDGLQRFVVGGDQGRGTGGRRRVIGRIDRFLGRDRGGDLLHHLLDGSAVVQGEQDVGGEPRDAFGELEKLFLGRDLPDRRQQRPAHSQLDQLRLRVASEQRRRSRRRGRLDGSG